MFKQWLVGHDVSFVYVACLETTHIHASLEAVDQLLDFFIEGWKIRSSKKYVLPHDLVRGCFHEGRVLFG